MTAMISSSTPPPPAGIRKLGNAEFKGIGLVIVYEVVSADRWRQEDLELCPETSLLQATEAQFDTGRALERA